MRSGVLGPWRALYLFAGGERRCGIPEMLQSIWAAFGLADQMISCTEVDVLRDPSGSDLTDEDLQQSFLDQVAQGEYQVVVCSPPCGTFSRVTWGSSPGPPPIRSRDFPLGRSVAISSTSSEG